MPAETFWQFTRLEVERKEAGSGFAESCLQTLSCDIVPRREQRRRSHGTALPAPRHGATGGDATRSGAVPPLTLHEILRPF